MKHCYSLDGYGYRLRPIRSTDASFVVQVRREDMERNCYIHPISDDVTEQERWLEAYFDREGDYYFVIESRITGQPEGLIAFYDVADGRAEWGRWVIRKGSLSAVESVYLLYRIAFEQVGLQELYCRTLCENKAVVSAHTSMGELTRGIIKNSASLGGKFYDAIEQYANKEHFYVNMAPNMESRSHIVARRNFKRAVGTFEFHHIGVATRGIEKELPNYLLMGYEKEGRAFTDLEQGIRGLFLTAEGQPRLELLENLAGRKTLDKPLEQGQKLYHMAYFVGDIERAIEVLGASRAKIIAPIKLSAYFKTRICFLMMPNMGLVELIEKAEAPFNGI